MRRIIRYRPSPAMIVACVALVLSVAGTSYAAITLPAGSVGTAQLKDGAVTSAKVKNGTLVLADIKTTALSSLGRVGLGSGSTTIGVGVDGTVATVTMTVPAKGFVLVNGLIDTTGGNGYIDAMVWDDTANVHSPYFVGSSVSGGAEATLGNVGVFPVAAGARTFSVRLASNGSSTPVNCWGTITAQFIPYGATGSRTSLAITKNPALAPAQH